MLEPKQTAQAADDNMNTMNAFPDTQTDTEQEDRKGMDILSESKESGKSESSAPEMDEKQEANIAMTLGGG